MLGAEEIKRTSSLIVIHILDEIEGDTESIHNHAHAIYVCHIRSEQEKRRGRGEREGNTGKWDYLAGGANWFNWQMEFGRMNKKQYWNTGWRSWTAIHARIKVETWNLLFNKYIIVFTISSFIRCSKLELCSISRMWYDRIEHRRPTQWQAGERANIE